MQTSPQKDNLIRKQVMLSADNIEKLESIAANNNFSSVAEVVRTAIDRFDPDNDIAATELMALVSSRLKEAIDDTVKTRKRLKKTLQTLANETQ